MLGLVAVVVGTVQVATTLAGVVKTLLVTLVAMLSFAARSWLWERWSW